MSAQPGVGLTRHLHLQCRSGRLGNLVESGCWARVPLPPCTHDRCGRVEPEMTVMPQGLSWVSHSVPSIFHSACLPMSFFLQHSFLIPQKEWGQVTSPVLDTQKRGHSNVCWIYMERTWQEHLWWKRKLMRHWEARETVLSEFEEHKQKTKIKCVSGKMAVWSSHWEVRSGKK